MLEAVSDSRKTKPQLIEELVAARARVAELERAAGEHQRVVHGLRRSAERWRSLVNTAPGFMLIIDPDGTIQYINRTVPPIEVEEVIGTSVYGYAPAEYHETMRACFAKVLRTGEFDGYESPGPGPDGSTAWYSTRVGPFRGEGGIEALILIVSDATERKQATEALRVKSAYFDNILRGSTDQALATTDLDQRITYFNPVAERLLGLSAGEVIGQTLTEIHVAQGVEPERLRRARENVRRTGEHRFSLERDTPQGRRIIDVRLSGIWEPDGTLIGYAFFANDVTDRKQAEEDLRESEERFRNTFEQAAVGIAHVAPNGRFLRINQRYCDIVGYTHDEMLTRDFEDIIHPDDRRAGLRKVGRVLAGDIPTCSMEGRYLRKDGAIVWGNLTVSLVRKLDGEPSYFIAAAEDITERKHLEELFRQSQKMEALGLLAGGIAHDFNNLITAILGNAEFVLEKLRSEPSSDGRYLNCLDAVISAGNRAASLTRQLLAFSRRQTIDPVVLDLNAILADMEQLLPRIIGERIKLTVNRQPELCSIEADAAQLEQVIMNLIVNARDAMPEGGALTVETADVVLDEEYVARHPEARHGRHAVLCVTDTGAGMSEDTIRRIFEPFFTTKPVGRGTGLGLSTVFGIVKQAGGHLTVESAPGNGAVFRVYLPAVDRPVTRPSAESDGELLGERELGGDETILVCEDEESIRRLTREILEGSGYTVLAAANGGNAVQLAETHTRPIDLLLTDVVMPGMNGRQLANAMCESRPHLKVLYMSGYPCDVLGTEGVSREEMELLEKPFGPDDLLTRVRDLLDAAD